MSKCIFFGRECPRTNDPSKKWFCPVWSDGVVWTDTRTGQEVIKNCGLEMLIPGMIEVIKASNRPAAAVESCRNEIAQGFKVMVQGMKLLSLTRREEEFEASLPEPATETKFIEIPPNPPLERGGN